MIAPILVSALVVLAFAAPILYGAALLDRYEERLMRDWDAARLHGEEVVEEGTQRAKS